MGGPSAPSPPDPKATASAQTATNIGTEIANQAGSLINQVTPYGTLRYDQTGTYTYQDPLNPTADPYEIPKYTAFTEFSPEGQELSDRNIQTQLNLAQLGQDQSAKLNSLLGSPVELGNEAVEGRIAELQRARMDPYFSDRRASLDADLANRGITRGSDAYDREVQNFEQNRNDAYNQMFLSGRGQAINEQLTERNQPLNEIIGLMSGSQVTQPQFVSTPSFNAPTVDYAGLVNNQYNQQLAAWNSQRQSGFPIGGLFGALGSLGGAAIGAWG